MNSLNGYSWKRITSNQSRLEEFSDTREVCIKDFEAERSKKKLAYLYSAGTQHGNQFPAV